MKHLRILAAALSLTAPTAALAEPPAAGTMQDYTFVFIRTGPAKDLTPEQSKEAFAGHFANMKRLADEGELLVAGPFGEPRAPENRGIFVIDEAEVDKGLALAQTDPAVRAGVFVLAAYRFSTDLPLRDLPRMEKEDEEKRLADPAIPDEWEGRSYVLATAPYSEALHKAARNTEGVLIAGRLHGVEGGDQVLVWVDAEDAEAGKAMLPEGEWTVQGWYGSKMVAGIGNR